MTETELTEQLARLRTYDEWVMAVASLFAAHDLWFGHGTTNAYDEAYWLVQHVQGWSAAGWERDSNPENAARVATLALRRVRDRQPLAYLLNEAWFAGHRYFVDERVLVPRSPLAELIERQFAPWLVLHAGDRVLDVGTGSGCIAIATALCCPDVLIDATDVSAAALEVARINVARHGLEHRVVLHRADLFPRGRQRYRVIIANPPYVPDSEHAGLPLEYQHEPRIGLVGGRDGVELAVRLLDGAVARLTPDGVVLLEVGDWAEALEARYPGLELTWLEFERGGEGVCLVSAHDLGRYAARAGD